VFRDWSFVTDKGAWEEIKRNFVEVQRRGGALKYFDKLHKHKEEKRVMWR
jgi:hypothetical protein